jgi:hypothetical protein
LLGLATALVNDPDHERVQLIARDPAGRASGFATVYWTWSATSGTDRRHERPVRRRTRPRQGLPAQLIVECRNETARRGGRKLTRQTAPNNLRAQAVYERLGATREQWVDYWLPC